MSSGYTFEKGRLVSCGDNPGDRRFNAILDLRDAARDLVALIDGLDDVHLVAIPVDLEPILTRMRAAEDAMVGLDLREQRSGCR